MSRPIAALFPALLASCTSLTSEPPTESSQVTPPPSTFNVFTRSTAVPGADATFQISGGAPNATVALVVSLDTSGPLACPSPIAPTCLDLRGSVRVLGTKQTNGSGRAVFRVRLPAGLPAPSVRAQAVLLQGGSVFKTQVIETTFLDPTLDLDGDGLSNGREARVIGSNWEEADSDFGGLDNYVEAEVAGTDPNDGSDDAGVVWDCDGQPTGVNAGDCAPDFFLYDSEGVGHSLSDYRGRVLLLDLSAMWCPFCQDLADDTEVILGPYAFDGVSTMTVLYENINGQDPTDSDLNAWTAAYDLHHPVVGDVGRTVRNAFGGPGQPVPIVIDRQGRISWRTSGYPGPAALVTQIGIAL